MTLNETVELLADTTRWRERIGKDDSLDPETREMLLDAVTVLRRFAKRRVQSPRPGDRWAGEEVRRKFHRRVSKPCGQ